jgi:hypothetical protein
VIALRNVWQPAQCTQIERCFDNRRYVCHDRPSVLTATQ